jgi:hypothetical protein
MGTEKEEHVATVTLSDNSPELREFESKVAARPTAQIVTAASDNLIMYDLGKIAADAGSPLRTDVGDYIDRGLILRRLLEEKGYILLKKR